MRFSIGQLTGMTESEATIDLPMNQANPQSICRAVVEVANVIQVPTTEENVYRFASKTVSNGVDALIQVVVKDKCKAKVKVNCEKMVIGNMLLKDLKKTLTSGK